MPRSPEMRVFLLHLAAYIVVNAILVTLNLMQTVPEGQARNYWFQWPLIGWGIGVAAHGLALLLRDRARPGSRLADERVRGFLVHLFVYVAVNILLIAVDLTSDPGAQWFWWPLLGWGAGLAAHGFAVWRATRTGHAATSLETESPWPESSEAESPKAGAVPPSPEAASAAQKPATPPPAKEPPQSDRPAVKEPKQTPGKKPPTKRAPRKPRPPRNAPPKPA